MSKGKWIFSLPYFLPTCHPKSFLFIYFWLHWVFCYVWFSLVSARGLLSSCSGRTSSCSGFSCSWSTGSGHMGFISCGVHGYLLRDMWNIPGAGIELMSPALAGRFLYTEPQGSSTPKSLIENFLYSRSHVVRFPHIISFDPFSDCIRRVFYMHILYMRKPRLERLIRSPRSHQRRWYSRV